MAAAMGGAERQGVRIGSNGRLGLWWGFAALPKRFARQAEKGRARGVERGGRAAPPGGGCRAPLARAR